MLLSGFNTHMDLGVQLDKKSLPFEAQFANFGPVECVDFGVTLKKEMKQILNFLISLIVHTCF